MKKRFPSTEEILNILEAETKQIFSKNEYELKELLSFDGEEFIKNAYEAILKRPPDPAGFEHYLQGLEKEIFTKEFILGALRYSKEGRQKNVKIHNLLWIYPYHFLRRYLFKIIDKLKFNFMI